MAIQYENECVDCPTYCIDCGKKHVPHYYCDDCGDENDPSDLYVYEDKHKDLMLCSYCLSKRFPTLEKYGIEKFMN